MTHKIGLNIGYIAANTYKTWKIILPSTVDTFDFSCQCSNTPQLVRVQKQDLFNSSCLQVFSLISLSSGINVAGRLQKDGFHIQVVIQANATADTFVEFYIIYNLKTRVTRKRLKK